MQRDAESRRTWAATSRSIVRRSLAAPSSFFLLNVGLTRTRVPTATPEDDRGEKAEPRRYALLTLIRHREGTRIKYV